jgi:carbamoyl-phosphate synthase large subunit
MLEYNVLILSAGRRVELINLFKDAAKKLSINSKIIAADNSVNAPALYFADKNINIPKIDHPDYINSIIEIAKKENIKLIVPTIDTDLLLLAQNKNFIEEETESRVLVSNYEVISICRNKLLTQDFLENNGFNVPNLYKSIENVEKYPIFIKPLDGSSSINAFKVSNSNELKYHLDHIKNPMIQEFIEGEEYTVDVFLDFDSNVIHIVPRLRIQVRAGEISKGKIIKNRYIIDQVNKLMNILRPIGHITVQLILKDNQIFYIEINPRFGGGAPMSIMSGANSCVNLYKILMDEKLNYNEDYEDEITFLRYDQSIGIKSGKKIL